MFIREVKVNRRLKSLDWYIVFMLLVFTFTPFVRVAGFVYQTSRGGSQIDSGEFDLDLEARGQALKQPSRSIFVRKIIKRDI